MKDNHSITPSALEQKIHIIRGCRVMLDNDLAEIYGVPAKVLNQAVKRNMERFPDDFCFQIEYEELKDLRSQIVTSSLTHGGRRYLPYVFTEHGALMASTVLNSPQAIQMSVHVIRAFVRLREILSTTKELAGKLAALESKLENQGTDIKTLFVAIRKLMTPPPEKPRKPIGFKP